MTDTQKLDVLVVGAGFSGMYMLYLLRQRGLKVRVFEAGNDVGGTWYWNRYPGARCDSESHYYCYSFSKELYNEWNWSSRYPAQPEILNYLRHVADRFELKKDITFNCRVNEAAFDEQANLWRIKTESGDTVTATFLVSATGCLSASNTPNYKGLSSFAGDWYHTGAWPHEEVDFSGKRVGLIGTGSSGIQATPVIAAEAKHLTVFQRTPNFTIPARNAPLTEEEIAGFREGFDAMHEIIKDSSGGFPFIASELSAHDMDEKTRQETLDRLWKKGGFRFLAESFHDLVIDELSNEVAAEYIRNRIREMVKDPEVAELLTPNDHPYGTKRPPIDSDYYNTYNRDNVALVNVRAMPIEQITPTGLKTTEKEYDLDIIVFATGFDAMTGSLLKMNIFGIGGQPLMDAWAAGPRTYLGLQIAGFPNLFTITGPGSPSVLTNMPVAIEQHVEWVMACMDYLHKRGFNRIEATNDAQESWVQHVNKVADMTLYPKANSWYVGANVPGKTRVFMPYVGGLAEYKSRCDKVAANQYEGFLMQ